MSNYFYAKRKDKNGRTLVTSYGKQAQAEKYGGASAIISNENFYLGEDGKPTKEKTKLILRSRLVAAALDEQTSGGNYVLYNEQGDQFIETPHRFDQYGKANNAMKSLADVFGTMLVIEEKSSDSPVEVNEPEQEPDDGPLF